MKKAEVKREVAGKLARVSDRVIFHTNGDVTVRRKFDPYSLFARERFATSIRNALGWPTVGGDHIKIETGEHPNRYWVWASFSLMEYCKASTFSWAAELARATGLKAAHARRKGGVS